MQGLAIEPPQQLDKRLSGTLGRTGAAAVKRVTHQRMVNMRHMNPYLMGPAGFQSQPQTGMGTKMLHNPIMGHCGFAHRMHRHMGPLTWMTRYRLFNCAAGGHI